MKDNVLLINFKCYKEASGKNALELAKVCEKVSKEMNVEIIVCVQSCDIKAVSDNVSIKVYAQHADEFDYGAHTGAQLIDVLKDNGASGTLINHSENRVSIDKIRAVIEKSKEKGFEILVCAKDSDEVKNISALKPDYLAYEPPELIGGDISVSKAKPEMVSDSVKNADDIPLIIGAGVKNQEDVLKAIELGSKGILVASGVVKKETTEEKEKAIIDLIKGLI